MATVPIRIAGVADPPQVEKLRESLAVFSPELKVELHYREFTIQLFADETVLPKIRAKLGFVVSKWGSESFLVSTHYVTPNNKVHDLQRLSKEELAVADKVETRTRREEWGELPIVT